MSRKRLGRGLDALLSSAGSDERTENAAAPSEQLDELNISDIVAGRYQPRRNSIRQPGRACGIHSDPGCHAAGVVRPKPQGGYELIAGERAGGRPSRPGLEMIPAVIREVSDEQASAMALIENIQREDLNPLEEAQALERLREEFELTQQQVADAVGKSGWR